MTKTIKQRLDIQILKHSELFIHNLPLLNVKKENINKLEDCKMIIAGSRTIKSKQILEKITEICNLYHIKPSKIISGTANGVDKLGEQWAKQNDIPVWSFPAKWDIFGKAAGSLRNHEMAGHGDVLFLIWDGKSSGSKSMKSEAFKRNLVVFELIVEVENKTYQFTDNEVVKNAILKRLEIKQGLCPCNPSTTDDYRCPCLKMRTTGACCCGLYIESK